MDEKRDDQRAAAPAEERSARQLLLVEDEELVALELGDELERHGWEIIGPATSLEGAQQLVATTEKIDAAVLDINLRGRWVHSLAEELNRRGVPFVVCTGYELIDPQGHFVGVPVIAKPASSREIVAALDDWVEVSAMPSSTAT